jgi:hypothetical protein
MAGGKGRPPTYKKEYAAQAAKLCALGATDQDIADFYGVTTRTVCRWKITHPEFCHALTINKGDYDDHVERSLAMRAIGYSHPDVDIRVVDGVIVQTPITKYYPPDTKAALAWLYNRRKGQWTPVQNPDEAEPKPIIINLINPNG